MSIFQKTLKYLFEICQRRDVYKTLYRCSNTERFLDVHLASRNQQVEYGIMPKQNKKVKLEWSKLSKLFYLYRPKSTNKKKIDLKKSVKEKKRGKKKSIVSQFLVEQCVEKSVESDSDDIVVVFDSTSGKGREEKAVSADSMGNINSESLDTSVFANVLENNVDWTSRVVPTQQATSYACSSSVIPPSFQSQHYTDGPERRKLKSMRQWEYTKFGSDMPSVAKSSPHLVFTLLSYNVLAQDLLESHPYLYRRHQQRALKWEYRSRLLLDEIQTTDADIMCLQEVQASHMESFFSQLKNLGYDGIFKKRTGENVDGVAIYYKKEHFSLVDYTSVEYYQPGIDILNRHNVGLIAKLAVKKQASDVQQHLVVATTHLLFNPRRHDVKLAQTQLLLSELDRYAFQGFRYGAAVYWPVIVTGDLNFEPHTGVYRLLTEGMFRYEGLSRNTLMNNHSYSGQILEKKLIPRSLEILDTCQHWGILCKRLVERMDHKTELKLLKIYNKDHQKIMKDLNMTLHAPRSFEDFVENARSEGLINNFVPYFGPSPIPPIPDAGYGTGQLTHNLDLSSVYSYDERDTDLQVTTYQGRWVTVDYILYSNKRHKADDNLKLIAKYKLLKPEEADSMGFIPNLASPSDHYPLLAAFYLKL